MNSPLHLTFRRLIRVAHVVLATFTVPAFGASPATAPTVSSSADEKRSDAVAEQPSLQDIVRHELEKHLLLSASGIHVDQKNGAITLTGEVRTYPDRDRAQEIAESVRGVTTVVNQLAVNPIARKTDPEIKRQVQAALAADGGTSGLGIDVAVDNGVVSLQGDVQSEPQRRVAGWLASRIPGVTGLNNELVVRPQSRNDADILRELVRHYETSAIFDDDQIEVTVRNGVVQLKGSVDAANEKTWAQMDAWVAGVKQVDASDLKVGFAPAPLRSSASHQTISDDDIREAIHRLYAFDPRIDSFKPDISVSRGVVTLSGVVSTPKAKQAAVQVARHLGGVVDVVDRLEVRSPEPRNDVAIAEALRAAFGRNAVIEAVDIAVNVSDGRVTLAGRAGNAFEKWTAGDIAERTAGVLSVTNNILVANDPPIFARQGYFYPTASSLQPYFPTAPAPAHPKDDAELVREVRSELSLNPFTDDAQVDVTAEHGVVTLRGVIESSVKQRAAATMAYQAGAKDVINQIHIADPGLSSDTPRRNDSEPSE